MKPIIATCVAFLTGDMIWLNSTAWIYRADLPPILAARPNLPAAVAFYALYLAGLVVFVVRPGLKGTLRATLARAAFFGLVAYGTYDFTNQATVADWPIHITEMDLLWGMFLSATASGIGWLAGRTRRG